MTIIMRTLISMLIVAAAVVGLCSFASAASAREEPEPSLPQIVGGWKPIENVNDPHIQELGRWAVSEHVKQASDGLVFGKVVSAKEQVIAGTNYKLIIQATKGGAEKSETYGAVVWEKLDKTCQLLLFDGPADRSI